MAKLAGQDSAGQNIARPDMGALSNILRTATYKRSKTGRFTEFASNECRVDYLVNKLDARCIGHPSPW